MSSQAPRIIIATIKLWNIENFEEFKTGYPGECHLISDPDSLTNEKIDLINPDYIFFIHWSWIIPTSVHEEYECIGFHMTDLPFGRGGSPLQNLIVRGYKQTMISAIKITQKLDAGPIYMKKPMNLHGSAEEIFRRASGIIYEMINEIINTRPVPIPQEGEVVTFKRRKPEESRITEEINTIERLYDHIRMLDAEGYPKAFIEKGNLKMEFTKAEMNSGLLKTQVRIMKKEVGD